MLHWLAVICSVGIFFFAAMWMFRFLAKWFGFSER